MPSANPQMSDSYGRIKVDEIENSGGDLVDLTAVTTDEATTSAKGYMSASDKTKLDGIEASATADQTGAEIKAAYDIWTAPTKLREGEQIGGSSCENVTSRVL